MPSVTRARHGVHIYMSKYDFYDSEKVDKLKKERAKKYMTIVRKWHDAKEKGDEKACQRAIKSLAKHRAEDLKLKESANEAGVYWF